MMMTAPSAHLRRAPEAENVENETPAIVQTTLEEESTNLIFPHNTRTGSVHRLKNAHSRIPDWRHHHSIT